MADTRPTKAQEKRILYEREVSFREMQGLTFFNRLMGTEESGEGKFNQDALGGDAGSIVQVKTELDKERGQKIYFYMGWELDNDGREDDETLEGNEEALNTQYDDVELHLYRHAVIDDGAMSRKITAYDIAKEMNKRLKTWGSQKIDKLCFAAVQASWTQMFYATAAGGILGTATYATAKSAIEDAATSRLSVDMIRSVACWARTGGNQTQSIVPPILIDGRLVYVLLVHPDCVVDLKADSDYANAIKDSWTRGKKHPIFTGMVAEIDNVVIHQHYRMTTFTDGGASEDVPGAKGVLLGESSICWAWGRRPYYVKDSRDYGNRKGLSWNMIGGVTKPAFKIDDDASTALDYSIVGLVLARTKTSDAISRS